MTPKWLLLLSMPTWPANFSRPHVFRHTQCRHVSPFKAIPASRFNLVGLGRQRAGFLDGFGAWVFENWDGAVVFEALETANDESQAEWLCRDHNGIKNIQKS